MWLNMNWLCGYLLVKVSGKEATRFFYLCSKHQIPIYNIYSKDKDIYFCNISIKNYLRVKEYKRKTKVHLSIEERHGLFIWIRIIFKHKFLLFIAVLGITVVLYMSQLIWHIEIKGNDSISDEILYSYLKNNNCYIGQSIDNIECSDIERNMRCDLPQIAWVSIYKKRNTVYIEIKEKITYDFGGENLEFK